MKNKLKHTPGPWITGGCSGRMIQPEDKSGTNYWIADVDIMANARLISAAPEMLEALIEGSRASRKHNVIMSEIEGIIERATGLSIEEVLK